MDDSIDLVEYIENFCRTSNPSIQLTDVMEILLQEYTLSSVENILNEIQKKKNTAACSCIHNPIIISNNIYCVLCNYQYKCETCQYYIENYKNISSSDVVYFDQTVNLCKTCKNNMEYFVCRLCKRKNCFCGCPKGCMC